MLDVYNEVELDVSIGRLFGDCSTRLVRSLIKEKKRQAAVANLIDHAAALADAAVQHCNYPDWDSSVSSIVFT